MEVVLPSIPQELVQNCTQEQIVVSSVPQLLEERVQNRTPDLIVDVPVPRILEAAVEGVRATPNECVVNRTPEQLVDEPVPRIAEQAVRVAPQECVVNRTSEQLVDEPLRSPRKSWRGLCLRSVSMNLLWNSCGSFPWPCEGSTSRTPLRRRKRRKKMNEDDDVRHFAAGFRPRRWCRFVVEGACCPYGSRCTFAHHESEFHNGASDSVLGPFLGAPAGPRGR